jgi:hypothetical protein
MIIVSKKSVIHANLIGFDQKKSVQLRINFSILTFLQAELFDIAVVFLFIFICASISIKIPNASMTIRAKTGAKYPISSDMIIVFSLFLGTSISKDGLIIRLFGVYRCLWLLFIKKFCYNSKNYWMGAENI